MKSAIVALLFALAAGCGGSPAPADDSTDDPGAWPPLQAIGDAICAGATADGDPCSDEGWCANCEFMFGCYCDGDHYECHQAESLCDFGLGAECAREGTPACHTPPAPAYCTCTAAGVECEYICPLPACPDFDAASTSCTCAAGDGNCA